MTQLSAAPPAVQPTRLRDRARAADGRRARRDGNGTPTEAVLADATTIGGTSRGTATAGAATADSAGDTPQDTIRAVALRVFDAIDAHPWIGTQLARARSQPALLLIFERIGQQLQALGVPGTAYFMSASALLNYILGVGGQNAANARTQPPGTARTAVLAAEATAWKNLDPDDFPFLRTIADELRDHDDRAQFLAGVDLILAGVSQPRQSRGGGFPGPSAGSARRPTKSDARTTGG